MNDLFREAVSGIQNREIDAWTSAGKKVVGYSCSYVPGEVFYAADILPVRFRGVGTHSLEIGDAYFGPFICTFPKCLLQLAGEGHYSFLDGVIITPGCDSMRRLDECWRKAGEDYPGIVPDFFHYFDVPHKGEAHGLIWFTEEIRILIKKIERHFKVMITDETLRHAIRVFNKGRALIRSLDDLRRPGEVRILGTEAFAISVAGTVLPRDTFTRELELFIASAQKRPPIPQGDRKRLMVVGSISDNLELLSLLENTGAIVVTENLCFGVRDDAHAISEDGDPVEALAKAYLGESTCPRMFGKYTKRLAILKNMISAARVDGVVLQNIRFCDLHGSENGIFERDLESQGIPCLRLEREYGPLVEKGRIKMRIDAFLERLHPRLPEYLGHGETLCQGNGTTRIPHPYHVFGRV